MTGVITRRDNYDMSTETKGHMKTWEEGSQLPAKENSLRRKQPVDILILDT